MNRVHHTKCRAGQITSWNQDCQRNVSNFRYADDTMLVAESKEKLESLLMKAKEESEKTGLKLNIQKVKLMAFGAIASWKLDGETVETVTDYIYLDSKITVDGYCSHVMKRHFFLGRKTLTNLDSILKSKDITLPTKVHIVKAMLFPVVSYGCESWTIKKAECSKINAVELYWRLLRVIWTKKFKPVSSKGHQSWISIGRTDAKAEAPVILPPDANHQLIGTRPWCWERLRAGGEGSDRGWDCWMASPTWWTWVWANSGRWWMTGKPGMLQSIGLDSRTWISDWTTTKMERFSLLCSWRNTEKSDYKVEQNGVTLRLLLVIKIPSLKLVQVLRVKALT